ncbi:MAG: hypothetical protein WAN36_00020 [Calditrichia bacterium]
MDLKSLTLLFLFTFLLHLTAVDAAVPQQTICIAYTANLNGQVQPCDCPGSDLGGIAYLSTVIDSLRREHPRLLLFDSGDFLNSYRAPVLNHLMWEFMNRLSYTAVGLGEQEFTEGSEFLHRQLSLNPLPLVAGNLRLRDQIQRPDSLRIIRTGDGCRIAVFSIFDANDSFAGNTRLYSAVPVRESLTKLLRQETAKAEIRILLYHGGFDRALQIAEQFPQIQIIIAGHSQQRQQVLKQAQVIVQPGTDGEFLGFLQVEKSNGSWEFKNSFIPVHHNRAPDRNMQRKIQMHLDRKERKGHD